MGNDILNSPATNEEPFYVIFWCISTFFRQNKTPNPIGSHSKSIH